MSTEKPMSTGEAILSVINRDLSLDTSIQVELNTDLLLTGQVDSLGLVQLVDWIEQTYELKIPAADVVLDNFQTVKQMVDYLKTRGVETLS